MAVATFGVDSDVIAASAYGMPITANTTPSTTEVGNRITEAAAWIGAILESKGVTPSDLTSGTTAYHIAADYVRKRATADVMLARQHRTDIAERLMDEARRIEERIVSSAAYLGANRDTGKGAPDITRSHVQAATRHEDEIEAKGDRALWMRFRREM